MLGRWLYKADNALSEGGSRRAYALHLFYWLKLNIEDFSYIVVVPSSTTSFLTKAGFE